jgi:hypothetical protein
MVTRSLGGSGDATDAFTVIVDCGTHGSPHQHEVTVGYARHPVRGVSSPANVRMQYTCPSSGATRMMSFRPPRGAARPFEIREIT